MTFQQKISVIKDKIGHTYSSWAQTLQNIDSYNGSIANAIIYALREVGKVINIWQKTILIPLEPKKRYYATYISFYTKDKVEYVRPRLIGILGWDSGLQIRTVGEAETAIYEEIEANQYIDVFKIGQKIYGSEVGFLTSSTISSDSLTPGYLDTIVSVSGSTMRSTILPTEGNIVSNLEFVLDIYKLQTTVVSVNDPVFTVEDNVGSSGWQVGDKLYISNGNPVFLFFEFQAIPSIDYLQSNSDLEKEIPILPQFQDDIDDIAIKHLFTILGIRNPDVLGVYNGLLNTGLVKPVEKVIADMRRRSNTIAKTTIKSYTPLTMRYGR